MKKLILPGIIASSFLFSACLPKDTAVSIPTTEVRNILAVDYEAPVHKAGGLPKFGFFPDKTNYSWTNKQSIAAASAAAMPTQSLEMIAATSTQHALGVAADTYAIEFDLKPVDLTSMTQIKVGLDYGVGSDAIQLTYDGDILFNGQLVASFIMEEVIHFALLVNIKDQTISIKINDEAPQDHIMAASLEDLHTLRFYTSGSAGKLYVDNVIVNAEFPINHKAADTDDGFYTLGFDTFDHSWEAYNTHEKGFSLTSGMKRSPGDNNVPDNGSKHCGYTVSTKPMLFHQFGYPFSLHAIDIAQYSSVYSSSEINITGYKMDGSSIIKTIDGSELAMTFSTFNFDGQWNNLRYVAFTEAASIDNLKLSIDDSTAVGFSPLN